MKFLFLLLSICTLIQSQAQISVTKIEPPNWWSGMELNSVQLMVYGKNLKDIDASFNTTGISVLKSHQLKNTDYAFIDIEIEKDIKSGEYELLLKSGKSKTKVVFPILSREKNPHHHKGFSKQDIIYLITPDRFANGDSSNDKVLDPDDFNPSDPASRHGGDIQGMIDHLDYIEDLGFTAIWPNPVLENNQKGAYHGYAWTDLYNVDKRFGSNELFKKFVDQAHERGIKIIFDHINNHIGVKHPWINNLPMEDWLNGSVENHHSDKHNMITMRDPYRANSTFKEFKTFWFVDEMPDINQNNRFVSKYYIQNSVWWIEYSGVDGIREDTYPYGFQEHSSEWAKVIHNEYPNFSIVGETWLLEPAFLATFQDKLSDKMETTFLPSLMDFPLMHHLRKFLKGENRLYDIYMLLAMDFVYPDPENLVVMMDNHDEARGLFIAEGDDAKVKMALQLVLSTRGIPQILYGTEINMLGGASHVLLREDFPGGFPNHTRSAFNESQRTEDETQMHNYVKRLIEIRKEYDALTKGKFTHYPPGGQLNNGIYTYFNILKDQIIMGMLNENETGTEVDLSQYAESIKGMSSAKNLFSGQTLNLTNSKLKLKGLSGSLYLLK